jgi:hypothetical protein
MSATLTFVLSIGILAVVVVFALRKMSYVRAAFAIYRMSFELEAADRKPFPPGTSKRGSNRLKPSE